MWQHTSIKASSYDLDALTRALDERSADGWEVLGLVQAGGEVAAILRKPIGDADEAAPLGATLDDTLPTETVVEAVPEADTDTVAPVVVGAAAVTAADAIDLTPSPDAVTAPVSEPAGWGAAVEPEPVVEAAPVVVEPEPAPEPAPVIAAAEPVAAEPVAAAPVAAPVQQASTTPAGWYPDPSGRFEMRYWDGGQWTEHVARGGQQYTDPPVA